MGNSVARGHRRRDKSRIDGPFLALPHDVTGSPAFFNLSGPAMKLLILVARQIRGSNNGRLLASMNFLSPFGWKSADLLVGARRELVKAGFLHETVKGGFPNRASWYAVTWRSLDADPNYDPGAAEIFQKKAWLLENAALVPRRGPKRRSVAPPEGTDAKQLAPSNGAMRGSFAALLSPPGGHHLDKPSPPAKRRRTRQVLVPAEPTENQTVLAKPLDLPPIVSFRLDDYSLPKVGWSLPTFLTMAPADHKPQGQAKALLGKSKAN